MTTYRHSIRKQIVILLVCLSMTNAVGGMKTSGDSSVIATVDGKPIFRHEIEVISEIPGLRPIANTARYLYVRVQEIIKEQAIADLGIQVHEKKVWESIENMFTQAGISEEKADYISNMYSVLITALEQWHHNKENSDKIYLNKLQNIMTETEWHKWQNEYHSPKMLAELRSLAPRNLNDMKENSFKSTKRDLLYNMLFEHITRNVKVEEDELHAVFDEQYENEKDKPDFLEIKKQLKNDILEKKKERAIKEWWKNRIMEARIVINDKQVNKAWEALLSQLYPSL